MAANPNNKHASLPPKPEAPADWECCGSECGEACIFEIYRREQAEYDKALKAQQQAA